MLVWPGEFYTCIRCLQASISSHLLVDKIRRTQTQKCVQMLFYFLPFDVNEIFVAMKARCVYVKMISWPAWSLHSDSGSKWHHQTMVAALMSEQFWHEVEMWHYSETSICHTLTIMPYIDVLWIMTLSGFFVEKLEQVCVYSFTVTFTHGSGEITIHTLGTEWGSV